MSKKRPALNLDPAFQRLYAEKKQKEREAKQARRVAGVGERALEHAKAQPDFTASEIAAVVAAFSIRMKKRRKVTRRWWEVMVGLRPPEEAAVLRVGRESDKKRPKPKRSD